MKAKQSFINAGYKQAEVEAAAQKVPAANLQISKPISDKYNPTPQPITPQPITPQPITPQPITPQHQTTTHTTPIKPKKISNFLIIILIVSSALILIGAAILGLFWSSWF